MNTYAERAKKYFEEGEERVRNTPAPSGQKFAPGTFVQIRKDLGDCMKHFESDIPARVEYTYSHAYGGSDVTSYSLMIRSPEYGWHTVSWYKEWQLTQITDKKLINEFEKEYKGEAK